MKIKKFQTKEEFIKAAITLIQNICKDPGQIHIALSGGSTPLPIYKALSTLTLPWDRINFYLVDERYAPLTHKDSNFRAISESLHPGENHESNHLPPGGQGPQTLHHFDTSLPIPKSLKKYEKELPKNPFDLTILGIGPDGHTASLFPYSKALKSKKSVAHTQTAEFATTHRLTLTFAPILASKNILILLGPSKKNALKELQNPKNSPFKQYGM